MSTETLLPNQRHKLDRSRFRSASAVARRGVLAPRVVVTSEKVSASAIVLANPELTPLSAKKERPTYNNATQRSAQRRLKFAKQSVLKPVYTLRRFRWNHIVDTHFWLLENLPFPGTAETITWKKIVRQWQRYDHHYHWAWRAANAVMALVVLGSVLLSIPPLIQRLQGNRYNLSASAIKLVGTPNETLASKLTYDSSSQTYEFNKDALTQSATANDPTSALLKAQTGSSENSKDSLYALDVPQNFSKGVTYHDTNTELSFSLTPQFSGLAGQQQQGRIVYPLNGDAQAIYSLKGNGLEEDLVVPKATSNQQTYVYNLNLPDTLQAKMIPGTGDIGIYSADPSLYGSISYGTNADETSVMKARVASAKTNLVFGLPAPVIKDTKGLAASANAHFVLHGNSLSIVADGLESIKGAFTIDPSVVVTSTTDFATTANNEGDIAFPSNQINRGNITGGSIGTSGWSTTSTGTYSARWEGSATVYNGYIYLAGGLDSSGTVYDEIDYAPINTNGTVGAWTAITSGSSDYTTGRLEPSLEAYNGYIYIYGGWSTGTAAQSDVQYAPIKSTGAPGTWTTSPNAMALGVCRAGYAVYNGYLYATGGANVAASNCGNTSTPTTEVQFAPILATGGVGTWTGSANTFTSARMSARSVAYNGYLYVVSGTVNGTGGLTDTQYAPITASGDVGTWITAAPVLSVAKYRFGMTVYNGYLYVTGGNGGGATNDTQYAQINANGSIGPWQTTATFATARSGNVMVAYNGYVYLMMGNDSGSTKLNDTQYAAIDAPGATANTSTPTNFTTARSLAASVVYNDKIYVIGGGTSTTLTSNTNTIYYASIDPTTGAIGTWTATTTALPAATRGLGATAFDGYLYIFGGYNGTVYSNTYQSVAIASGGNITASWSAATSFDTNGRYGLQAVMYNNFVYVVGGYDGSTYYNTVRYAPVTSGTIGTWASANTFSTGRYQFGLSEYGGYLYVLGGQIGSSTYTNDIEYAVINNDGSLGTWTSNTVTLPTSRGGLMSAVYNGNIYMIGGYDGTTYDSDVQYAPLNMSNGSVGAWTATQALDVARYQSTAVVGGNYLYIMGGNSDGSTYVSSGRIMPFNNGGSGSAGAWTAGNSLTSTLGFTASLAYNGYLYALGGNNSGTYVATVDYVALNPNGTMGTWATTTAFTTARRFTGVAAYNGYMYILGGDAGSPGTTTPTTSVEYAAIASNGTVGSWTATTSLPEALYSEGVTVYNGRLYVTGGNAPTPVMSSTLRNEVEFISFNANGTLGASWTTTSSFTGVRYGHTTVAYNGYMYIFGGWNGTATLSDVQYAPINSSDGTTGTFAYTESMPPRRYAAMAVYDGHMYIAGGTDASSNTKSDVLVSAFNSNGTIGPWSYTAPMTVTRDGPGTAIYNGYIYSVGGNTGATPLATTEYAPLNTIARIGHYSKIIDLNTISSLQAITYNGLLPTTDGQSKINYRAAPISGTFASLAAASTLSGGDGTSCTTGASTTRYVWVGLTLDDSYTGAVFPDTSSAEANVTDFTVVYQKSHALPQVRLRGGQYFNSGGIQPLDTCVY
jgi:N-acetylneuraminic acid mutarotase